MKISQTALASIAMMAIPLAIVGSLLYWEDHKPLPKGELPDIAPPPVLPTGPVRLSDVTKKWELDFEHNNGAFGAKWIPESLGSGAVFFDYDNDGDPDLFLVNGRNWTDAEVNCYRQGPGRIHQEKHGFLAPANLSPRQTTGALFKNEGGRFRNVTAGSGLDVQVQGFGGPSSDFDGDGKSDLFVTSIDGNFLFRNLGDGRFRNVTKEQGLVGRGLCTSSAWLDYDRDGRLDLFVCRYVLWSPERETAYTKSGLGKAYSGPGEYKSDVSALYRNTGSKFVDVSESAGISRQLTGLREALPANALGVAVLDANADGWPDIAVTSDKTANRFFLNNCNGTFREVGLQANFVLSYTGIMRAGMGIDSGDFEQSGRDNILVGNFSLEAMGLYRAMSQSNSVVAYDDVAGPYSLISYSEKFVTFGCQFTDIDGDGRLDIVAANGHVRDEVEKDPMFNDKGLVTYEQRPLLLLNNGLNKTLKDVGFEPGKPQPEIIGRGLACADIDLDGNIDVLFTTLHSQPLLLRNSGGVNQAVRLVLMDAMGRDAIGARVEARVGKQIIRRNMKSGSSYLSQSELPLTVGVGKARQIDELKIQWASGTNTILKSLPVGTNYTIHEKTGVSARVPLRSP